MRIEKCPVKENVKYPLTIDDLKAGTLYEAQSGVVWLVSERRLSFRSDRVLPTVLYMTPIFGGSLWHGEPGSICIPAMSCSSENVTRSENYRVFEGTFQISN